MNTPEVKLWRAVIIQAVYDLVKNEEKTSNSYCDAKKVIDGS